ncbi:MAG TPA: hypothetical protein VIL74_18990 [Pyrinomonadaceae bacterium]|jgi:hypothetical protein
MEIIQFEDLANCARLSNGDAEVVVATEFGPRVLAFNFIGGANVLGWHPHAAIQSPLGEYRIYGGHRLWIAPEVPSRTYAPDSAPIEWFFDEAENSIRLVQPVEPVSGTRKEMTVKLAGAGGDVTILHKITNVGDRETELAAWALTIMRGGGTCEIPNEPFAPYGGETLLPVRNLTVWAYTDLSDPRWTFDRELIRLRVDESRREPQKIGVLNKRGWARYRLADSVFTKHFDFRETASYPDMNSNTELYVAGSFVEVETLAPLVTLKPGESTEHVERWRLEPTER